MLFNTKCELCFDYLWIKPTLSVALFQADCSPPAGKTLNITITDSLSLRGSFTRVSVWVQVCKFPQGKLLLQIG